MYSAAAKNDYTKLVAAAMQKLASSYGVELQADVPADTPEEGVKDEASPQR